ncbi:hypothetical protein [Tuwongella immobilis]|uniref:Uncharacterized protein n=1 Tax=Tuwongella immobilis TaxID=692036 RepID=A0A6C2YJR6_9BACT|nr:hypothetical protein [Tuwongella immobilis]VIP01531.1 Uncharacterized protein OS=Sorangium cellulosum (strain So ce56) GN=sce5710 PE=4 SV=1 [Tuwongella immobilis]VTR98685.1 Uncharacterized protein OS=Sorangium cellulosum (strain So ce56) GN=sce5710 PE=4 SV=1 [Tuwongella immobilis]
MTEAEWLGAPHLYTLIRLIEEKASERRRRLLACACCRRTWNLLPDDFIRDILELAEQYADGMVTSGHLRSVQNEPYFDDLQNQLRGRAQVKPQQSLRTLYAISAIRDLTSLSVNLVNIILDTSRNPRDDYIPTPIHNETTGGGSIGYDPNELDLKIRLLHDIFGPRLDSLPFVSTWRTSAAFVLAHQMYQSRDFSSMPMLADALEVAGCDNQEILRHCREPGIHVRGCWVVDLVLGNE